MKENFQIHIWLGLLLCLLGMSCSDDTGQRIFLVGKLSFKRIA